MIQVKVDIQNLIQRVPAFVHQGKCHKCREIPTQMFSGYYNYKIMVVIDANRCDPFLSGY